ncbi:DUF4339 domain-containing protein [Planctomycetes bacterium K23_9]|uniref:GYF domain-containing protein n=1 Tax=Stieleria marina TaxID=1930275 RepID=A0A517NPX6_9BACT|nr:hypothetical protein K239x_11210 [Planctomycetes bacterium K23_9]
MGVRFACHRCGKHLNIKQELAGRRGICPNCATRFRIPLQDAAQSCPIESSHASPATTATAQVADGAVHRGGTHAAAVATKMPVTSAAGITASGTVAPIVASPGVSSLDLLTGDPEATWYVRPPTGGQYGPADAEVLRQWISEGRVASTALLWRDGWPQWREASEALPELAAQFPDVAAKGTTSDANGSATAKTLPVAVSAQQPSNGQANPGTVNPANETAHVVESSQSDASANQSASVESSKFGYEDSDFANGVPYTTLTTESPKLKGRDDVGSVRRDRTSKRTQSIIWLGLVALVLVVAIIYLVIR